MQGQDIALLLKLAIEDDPRLQSKKLAESLSISRSEVSKALRRCVDAGLLYVSGAEKRVNRSGLLEFLAHGLRYVFPPVRGSMIRGVPTAASAEPLKSRFVDEREPPTVWPYGEGKVRGIALAPLYAGAPKAALRDQAFYSVLALSDAIRSGRTRERNLALELLKKEIHA
ncbi:MAG: winged helix-turn-helix domain-containing protein [Terracidiphilus sp.]